MKLKDKIKLTLNIFGELRDQKLLEDKESDQINKISDMLGALQSDEKYAEDILKIDNIFSEITKLIDILTEKYIKIGVALERTNDGFYIGGKK